MARNRRNTTRSKAASEADAESDTDIQMPEIDGPMIQSLPNLHESDLEPVNETVHPIAEPDVAEQSKDVPEAKPKADDSNVRTLITVGSISPRDYHGDSDVDEFIDHFLYIYCHMQWVE